MDFVASLTIRLAGSEPPSPLFLGIHLMSLGRFHCSKVHCVYQRTARVPAFVVKSLTREEIDEQGLRACRKPWTMLRFPLSSR